MDENFLYFVWQYRYMNFSGLQTECGQQLKIKQFGVRNDFAGPDFLDALICLDGLDWFGKIEMHVKASDWYLHKHHHDKNYDNVVLHVVFENDRKVYRTDGTEIPSLELKKHIDTTLIERYQSTFNQLLSIPCANGISSVNRIKKLQVLDASLYERVVDKANDVLSSLRIKKGDWYQVLFELLSKNFGVRSNQEGMMLLAEKVDYQNLAKKANDQTMVEALLFGQAGLLQQVHDNDYTRKLKDAYGHFQNLFQLPRAVDVSYWNFAGVRPVNYPTLKIAQLAAVVIKIERLYGYLSNAQFDNIKELFKSIDVHPFWQTHYHFQKETKNHQTHLGDNFFENIVINTIVPFIAARGKYYDDEQMIQKAIEMLSKLKAERNRITKKWFNMDEVLAHAGDSQAFIHLYKNKCSKKKCLDCSIGIDILKQQIN